MHPAHEVPLLWTMALAWCIQALHGMVHFIVSLAGAENIHRVIKIPRLFGCVLDGRGDYHLNQGRERSRRSGVGHPPGCFSPSKNKMAAAAAVLSLCLSPCAGGTYTFLLLSTSSHFFDLLLALWLLSFQQQIQGLSQPLEVSQGVATINRSY